MIILVHVNISFFGKFQNVCCQHIQWLSKTYTMSLSKSGELYVSLIQTVLSIAGRNVAKVVGHGLDINQGLVPQSRIGQPGAHGLEAGNLLFCLLHDVYYLLVSCCCCLRNATIGHNCSNPDMPTCGLYEICSVILYDVVWYSGHLKSGAISCS